MTAKEEVDLILDEWRVARSDLDVSALSVFSRLSRIAKHLNRARAAAFARSGLELWEFDVLAVLRRAGEPYRVNTRVLVQQTMVSSGTMTNRIDRLQERGLVVRQTDPRDGRAVIVEMTNEGKTLIDTAFTRLVDAEEVLLAGLTADERKTLAQLLRSLSQSVNTYGSLPMHGGEKSGGVAGSNA